jgi:hypothetical protein
MEEIEKSPGRAVEREGKSSVKRNRVTVEETTKREVLVK